MDDDMNKKDKQLEIKVEQFITKHFGKRCPKYCVDCPTCDAWVAFYTLFNISDAEELAWEHHQNSRKKRLSHTDTPASNDRGMMEV